jgi:cytochrome c peroxidase
MDNRFRSHGVGGENLVNTPSIFNTGFNFVQSWDGRASSLDAHLESHLTDKRVMASSWSQLIGKLVNNAEVSLQFARIYDDGITATNIKDVIATYERSLVTPNSRFDKFLRGDPLALSHEEKQGYELFQSYGCSRCHQGINLGGNMFAKMGLMGDYFKDRGDLAEVDNGRYNVNHEAHSLREFRVPSLRNVALTSPYFHDGYAKSLEQAVSIMAKYQLGRAMPDSDVALIAQFLRTLTGTYLGKPL